eukprot:s1339_g14.t1
MDAMEVATMAAPLELWLRLAEPASVSSLKLSRSEVSSTSSVHPGRWCSRGSQSFHMAMPLLCFPVPSAGTTLARNGPAASFGQRSAESASSTWHTGCLASTAIVGLAASRPTRRRLQSRQLRQTCRAADSPVVLEVKEVEAKSTDEDEKQILKGLNLTIRAGEAACSHLQ